MTDVAAAITMEPGITTQREVGRWDTGLPGPTLMVTGALHGNEPAGIYAAQRVLARLQEHAPQIRGRFLALCGNLAALREGKRFLARDLNRSWDQESLTATQALDEQDRSPEDNEQLELLQCFVSAERTASGPLVYVDMHTSSADGSPFLCLADTIDNRRLGLTTGVPIILGIEETIAGASLEWFADRGILALTIEGGQHDSDDAIANHEAVLWGLLVRLGMLPEGFVDLAPHRERLRQAVGTAPPVVEILHRHVIAPDDAFRMEPGFLNFAKVAKGQLLAKDRGGEIRAKNKTHVMLPLYQELGDDGFFLARRVRWFWLWLAKWLRALHVAALLPLMPGIRRDPHDHDTMLANPSVARWFVVEVFHLLGFRKVTERSGCRAFRRRSSRPENRWL
tara:strand:+ start:12893 stop:14077 length:1185 start_codon:yes stop_codon:yes gene_type:complete